MSLQQHRSCFKMLFLPLQTCSRRSSFILLGALLPTWLPSVMCLGLYLGLSACFPSLACNPSSLVTPALLLGHTDCTAHSGRFGLTSPSLTRFTDSPSPPSADPTAAPHLGALFSLRTERSRLGQTGALTWSPGEVISSPASAPCAGGGLVPAVSGP